MITGKIENGDIKRVFDARRGNIELISNTWSRDNIIVLGEKHYFNYFLFLNNMAIVS